MECQINTNTNTNLRSVGSVRDLRSSHFGAVESDLVSDIHPLLCAADFEANSGFALMQ